MFQNSSAVIIGKLYSASDLGLYTRAQSFSDTLSRTLSSVVGRVAFPYFSSLQTEPAKMRMRLRQFLRLTAMFHFPAMIGLAAAAPALVNALLTEKWAECVPLLRILSFSGFLYPLHAYHLQALVALGRSDLFFRLEVVKKLLIVMNLLITSHISVFAMACGLVITSSFSYWINSFYTRRLLAYSWSEQLGDLLPPLIASLIVGAVGLGAGLMHTSSSWITLGLQIMAMLLVFGATVITAMKSKVPELVVVVASVLGRNR